jgi:hypothetical protein
LGLCACQELKARLKNKFGKRFRQKGLLQTALRKNVATIALKAKFSPIDGIELFAKLMKIDLLIVWKHG